MDVRIGVIYTAKELDIEMGDDVDRDALQADIETALSGDGGLVWLTDRRGRKVGVPIDKVAYVEIGIADDERRIGFGH